MKSCSREVSSEQSSREKFEHLLSLLSYLFASYTRTLHINCNKSIGGQKNVSVGETPICYGVANQRRERISYNSVYFSVRFDTFCSLYWSLYCIAVYRTNKLETDTARVIEKH
jgi:hypothetical protein